MSIKVKTSGPIFDGTAIDAVHAFQDAAEQTVAEYAVNQVQQVLHSNIRHSTGHYISNVRTEMAHGDQVVTDGNIVYGPWLEGVSSRNSSTRFKGYAAFRRTVQELRNKVGDIAESVLPTYLERMK